MPMFKPSAPFELAKDGEHYGAPGKLSSFLRELAEVPFQIGGVYIHVYRYEGTFDQQRDHLGVLHDEETTAQEVTDVNSFLGVQDPLLGENRDRKYNFDEVPVIKAAYQVSASELELLRFGISSNETLSLEFHQGQIEQALGRRLIQGDVIEMPHLRETSLDGRSANRWYEVKDISWSPAGYDPSYQRHIVGVIVQPIRHQQEFLDLMENVKDEYGKTLAEQTSNLDQMMAITAANQAKAGEHVSTTWHDTTIMWFDPCDPDKRPCRHTDDGKPPNGLEPVGQGETFPAGVPPGSYFIRTDFAVARLYRLDDTGGGAGRWRLVEEDAKRDWLPYNWTAHLRSFMSDRSDADNERPYELRSIHDVLTDREHRSNPSGDADI